MPEYKVEYPNLKRRQYIEMIQKEFKKSPENPVYKQKMADAGKEQNKGKDYGNDSD